MTRFWWIIVAVMAGGLILLFINDTSGSVLGIENDMFARLVYLGVLGTVIGAGILGSRRYRLGDTARALALWTIVILVLVIGYQYRYELQDIARRLTGGLI